MSFLVALDSSASLVGWFDLAADPPRWRAQGFDLRRGLDAAIGDDLFEHLDALLELVAARGILGGFLGGEPGLDFELPFAEPEEAMRHVEDGHDREPNEDQQRGKKDWRSHRALPPLSIASASISRASERFSVVT